MVIDEFDRDRGHVVASLSSSTRAHVRTIRAAPVEHGRGKRNQDLVEGLVVNRSSEAHDLLDGGRRVAPATGRALDRSPTPPSPWTPGCRRGTRSTPWATPTTEPLA